MSTFALIHGAGGSGWEWHLVEAELRARGHRCVAPDLPAGDESASLEDYASAVDDAIGDADDLIVVAHSFGGFTGPLVAERRRVSTLVLVAAMVPSPGESPEEWWSATGHTRARREAATLDGGLTGNDDPLVCYYHDVPDDLAAEAQARERPHPSTTAYVEPWPLERWPDVPTRFVLCTEDRLLPAGFLRDLVRQRLGLHPEELRSGHCPALAHPGELAALLDASRVR